MTNAATTPAFEKLAMVSPTSDSPQCPRCGSTAIALCGQSIQYGPPEQPDQSLQAREIRTLAYE
ncbi:MAG TPA: hypothetical protein VHU84_11665, partial [Lacipirellulaceae bacterium]|nr:hypothetical protein [Lacipirellulaceae bacterium]